MKYVSHVQAHHTSALAEARILYMHTHIIHIAMVRSDWKHLNAYIIFKAAHIKNSYHIEMLAAAAAPAGVQGNALAKF